MFASEHCPWCRGLGYHRTLCGCVRRRAFRIALDNYHSSPRCSVRWLLYRADFMLTVKKLLPGARERRAFDAFFLDGREYPDVAPLLRLNRGNFFHWVYATEQKVGDALIRRGIFPLEVYFGGPHRPRVEVIKGRARAKLTGSWGASSAYMILAA